MSSTEVVALLNRLSIFTGVEKHRACNSIEALMKEHGVLVSRDGIALAVDLLTTAKVGDEDKDLIRACCLVLSESCLQDDQLLGVATGELGVTSLAHDLARCLETTTHAGTLFTVLDAVATLASANGAVRVAFRPYMGVVLNVIRRNKTNMDLLFGSSCALATLTLADTLNGKSVLENNGLQVLLEVFKFSATKMNKNIDVDAASQILRWSRQALFNLMKVPFAICDEKLQKANFGVFGENLVVDELKFDLRLDRERSLKLLEEFRALRTYKDQDQQTPPRDRHHHTLP